MSDVSRLAAIHVLVFQFGGVAGAIRRIAHEWPGRFSRVQICIALQRRCPLLVGNQYQVEDCLDCMEKQRLIEVVVSKHTKIYQHRKHENKFQNRSAGLGNVAHSGQVWCGGMLGKRAGVLAGRVRLSVAQQGQRTAQRADAILQPMLPWLEKNPA